MNRLQEKYKKEILPALKDQFKYKNISAVPKISKVTVNVGFGKTAVIKDTKLIERMEQDVAKITGQQPSVRKAKKSIAGFKLREGMPIGYLVTLRGARMYDFIDRLISIALPRTRDFQGLSSGSFDEHGNFTVGIKEHNIFPEITYESLKDIFGLEVTVVTNAGSREVGRAMLKMFGFPLKEVTAKGSK